MHPLIRLQAALGLLTLLLLPAAYASAPLPNQVTLVPDASVAANPVKAPVAFTVPTTGSYTLTLIDEQEPSALASLSVALVSSTQSFATLSLPSGTKQTSETITLAAGSYFAQVQVAAAASSFGGTFDVQLTPAAGGNNVLYDHDVIAPPSTPGTGQSGMQGTFTVDIAGNYTLSVTDFAFPAALSAAPQVLVLNSQSLPVLSSPGGPTSAMLAADTYTFYAYAQADPVTLAGLYGLSIGGSGAGAGSPATVLIETVPVGELPAPTNFNMPAAGTVSVALKDIAQNPALSLVKPLGSLKAIVTQAGSSTPLLSTVTGPSGVNPYSFTATAAGQAQLYVAATPNASTGQSGWAAYVSEPVNGVTTTLADIAEPVVDGSHYGYGFQVPALPGLTANSPYTLAVHDFMFPNAMTAQESLVFQQGVLLASQHASNPASVNLNFTPTVAGAVNLMVFPVPASNTSNGLLGLAVEPGSGPNAFQATQAVGSLFNAIPLYVQTAGTYGVTLTDLGFPAAFSSLSVLGTQGNAQIGQVTTGGAGVGGSGTFTFSAPAAGSYVLNVLAQDGATVHYGLYGLEAGLVPTVTLTPGAVSVGGAQDVTLSWTSTNATGCAASGGWSGAQPVSGNMVNVGAITQTTSYTLICTGAGGPSAPQTVTVNPSSSSSSSSGGGSGSGSKSGGGAITPQLLLALSLLAGLKLRRRRAMLAGCGLRD
jgi:hypothetical protein